ncbi:hypothetical protein PR001_g24250 [Phytophthora rubi]|uniref:Secreted protein n=1 Tax=Phytophthora rubi TaxID=129364 RepID=A0A6A3IF25_9STRA|nr:hypothetical protein PR001_g24250 [Phytophthora rubi]
MEAAVLSLRVTALLGLCTPREPVRAESGSGTTRRLPNNGLPRGTFLAGGSCPAGPVATRRQPSQSIDNACVKANVWWLTMSELATVQCTGR